ncbi:MAG: adenylate/guanylate cyclase domain-containing protein [Gammaproteobacteria bacterium]
MKFSELVSMAADLLQARGRVTYRALQLEYDLDAATLESLRDELLFAHPQIADVDGRGLTWQASGAAAPVSPAPPAAPPAAVLPADEYRQLTVMFCDLVGSTALVSQIDPETWQALLAEYHAVCARAVARFGGHIAQFLGDGVLVYFGYPSAHEDDAVRAAQAACEILAEMATGAPRDEHRLRVRIGLHTGAVMVTGVGAGTRRETLALGEAPHVAARLQAEAAPGTLLVSGVTARLLAGRFDLEPRGARALAGVETAVEVFEVRGADSPRSAFDAAVARGLTPAVGRDHELGLVLDRAARARQGNGQVVLVIGEPGIGKSRLARDAREKGNLRVFEYRCSAYFQHSALYPLVQFLTRALGFAPDEPPAARLARLAELIEATRPRDDAAVPLLAALLSIPESAGYVLPPMSAAVQRQRTFALLIDTVMNEAAREPLCLLFEDLHWADPTTLDFLGQLIDQVAIAPLLVFATARPEFAAPWPPRAHVSPLMLGRLSPAEVMSMVAKVARGKTLPPEVAHQILVRTDGIPLFVEELTKALLESGQLRETIDAYVVDGALPTVRVPDTLQESLQARLDRLQGAREVAQIGAVIGREFGHSLLVAVAQLEEATLVRGLGELLEAELVYQRGQLADRVYQFKHALVRDAAYQSLPRRRRQELHACVAASLQTEFPEVIATQPELVAQHLTEAGRGIDAVPFWLKAGQRALERSANPEAIAHLNRGLELLSPSAGDPAQLSLELALLTALAPALMSTKGYAHADVLDTYARVREIAHVVENPAERFRLLFGTWLYYGNIPDFSTGIELTSRMIEEAAQLSDPAPMMLSELAHGVTLGWMGQFEQARRRIEKAVALYDHELHYELTFYCGLNPRTFGLIHGALACWHLGFPDTATERCRSAVNFGEELHHPPSIAHAASVASWTAYLCGDQPLAERYARLGFTISSEFHAEFWRGWTETLLGIATEDVSVTVQGIEELRATGAKLGETMRLGMLAELQSRLGRYADAEISLDNALTLSGNGEQYFLAELYRLKGEIALARDAKTDEAFSWFARSLDQAREQGALAWELRTAVSAARVLAELGRRDAARSQLLEVYGRFAEGFDTRDLREARALLSELANAGA